MSEAAKSRGAPGARAGPEAVPARACFAASTNPLGMASLTWGEGAVRVRERVISTAEENSCNNGCQ